MSIIKKITILYFILLATFTMLVTVVFLIPTDSIRGNVAESAKQIQEEGLWFQPFGFYLFQIDNMTDCLMMNINACADTEHPIRSAMMAEHAQPYENGDTKVYLDIANTTYNAAVKGCDESTATGCYARYWHGYQVVVRPLLYFFNYNQIRVLNYIALFFLLTVTVFLLYKVLNLRYAITFFATLLLSNIMIVPLAIQFSICFYIALLTMILILVRPQICNDRNCAIMLFFTVGAVTGYMDFLTTPLLTLGFPLVVMMALTNKNKIKTVIIQSVAWFGGYALLWASKWLIGWMLTGENILDNALGCARQRIGNTIVFGGEEMPMRQFFDIITTKVQAVVPPLVMMIAIILICVIAALTILYFYKKREQLKAELWLLLIAAMPLLWFIVMKNHSLQHIFFTWRDWMLTLWCLFIFIFHTNRKIERR